MMNLVNKEVLTRGDLIDPDAAYQAGVLGRCPSIGSYILVSCKIFPASAILDRLRSPTLSFLSRLLLTPQLRRSRPLLGAAMVSAAVAGGDSQMHARQSPD